MNKVRNFGKTGIVAVFCLLVTSLLSSCEETFIHADHTMPGVWVVENIICDISCEEIAEMPFRIGDEVEFMDDGCLYFGDGRYENYGDWWVEEHFNATYISIKVDDYRYPMRGRISDVYAGRVVWSVYPQCVSDYWMGEPVTEVTFLRID